MCRLVDSLWSSSKGDPVHIVWLHSMFGKFLRRKLGRRSGHLITYSSCLLLLSMGKFDSLGMVLCNWKIWKMCSGQRWVEHGGAWYMVSVETKWASCRELFPAKSCFLPCAVLSCVPPCATPWTVAWQPPLSMGFPRQEYWSWLPLPPPEGLPKPGIELQCSASPGLAGGFFTTDLLSYLQDVKL